VIRVVEAKVFKNGGSNAIRIPASFKLEAPVVYLSFDEDAGEITVSKNKPQPFAKLLALHEKYGMISDAEWDIVREPQEMETRPSISALAELK
jgi:antitoxin VapB